MIRELRLQIICSTCKVAKKRCETTPVIAHDCPSGVIGALWQDDNLPRAPSSGYEQRVAISVEDAQQQPATDGQRQPLVGHKAHNTTVSNHGRPQRAKRGQWRPRASSCGGHAWPRSRKNRHEWSLATLPCDIWTAITPAVKIFLGIPCTWQSLHPAGLVFV